jgi:hypothetical protein
VLQATLPGPIRRGEDLSLPTAVIDPKHQELRRIDATLRQETPTSLGPHTILAVDYSRTLRWSLPAFGSRDLGIAVEEEVLDLLGVMSSATRRRADDHLRTKASINRGRSAKSAIA